MDIQQALRNLLDGTASEEEINLVKSGLSKGQISIGGNVNQSIVIVGSGNTVKVTPEAFNRIKALKSNPFQVTFELIIKDKTREFIGRGYIFSTIQKFLDEQTKGYFIVEGDPGMGKSSLLAEYIRRTDCANHFNSRVNGITRTSQFLESITYQLTSRYNLDYKSPPKDPIRFNSFLIDLLQNVSSSLKQGEKLVIAVDALDEIDPEDVLSGRNILSLPQLLPEKVYFIVTQRRGAHLPFMVNTPIETFDLLKHLSEGRIDVVEFLENVIKINEIEKWYVNRGMNGSEFINVLAEKSENNFMYLRYVLLDISKGFYETLGVKDVPTGLQGYYESHWNLMGMKSKPVPKDKIKIVYLLAESRQPISRALIANFAKESELTVQLVLNEWEQFLHRHPKENHMRYGFYHASFKEFLHRKDIIQAAGVSIDGINALIANTLWDEW